jgi:hypothetical protein
MNTIRLPRVLLPGRACGRAVVALRCAAGRARPRAAGPQRQGARGLRTMVSLANLAGHPRAARGQLDTAAASLGAQDGVDRAREAFVAARRAFKHVELGLEYYTPSTARGMNGPALPEVEETEGPEAVYPPTGFQVIEEVLYATIPGPSRSC